MNVKIIVYDEETFLVHCKMNKESVGYLAVNWNYIAKIHVAPEYRNRGVGSVLLQAAETRLRFLGHKTVTLHSFPGDEQTSKDGLATFYGKNGYKTHDGTEFRKALL